jgi:hypothetical protein
MPHIDELLGITTIAAAGLAVALSLQGPVSATHGVAARDDAPVSHLEPACYDTRSQE